MSYTQSDDEDGDPKSGDESSEARDAKAPDLVPEITLDRAIQDKIDEATELLKKTSNDLAEVTAEEEARGAAEEPAPEIPAATAPPVAANNTNNAELQKISSELAKAKTIDDVDDKMAETLFGEEFSQIAAQVAAHVAANPSSFDDSANEDLQLVPDKGNTGSSKTANKKSNAAGSNDVVDQSVSENPDNNLSATQRLRTVRALNGNFDPVPEPTESVVLASKNKTGSPPPSGEQPESIEDQINTSMTQTLKALNVRPPPTIRDDDDDDDDDDDGKSGFFSRFRRS
jgi:hypothetical protein